jgi:hypothetical protein
MARKFKALGLGLVAMFALSAFGASAAQAFPFTLSAAPADLTGFIDTPAKDVFTTSEGTVECSTISFTGTGSAVSATEQSIQPSYSGCTAFGLTAHVNASACTYLFTTPTTGPANERTGEPPHVKCPGGGSITITPTLFGFSVCTSRIGEQTPTGGHIIYTNKTDNNGSGKMTITLHTTATGVHYIGTGGVCGPNGVTSTDGTYTGTEILRAYKHNSTHNNTNQIDVTTS